MNSLTDPTQYAHEIIPNLWLGNRAAASNKDNWLVNHNIQVVFNATKDIPFSPDTPTEKYRIPVDDSLQDEDINNMGKWSPEVVYNILKEYQAGKVILIHCAAGMQRSAAAVAMTLISLKGMTTEQAIDYIQGIRAIAFTPGANFYKSIKMFENYYHQVLRPTLQAALNAKKYN